VIIWDGTVKYQNSGLGALSVNVPFTCLVIDGLGNLVRFILMPGQRGETTGVERLMGGIRCGSFLGDKAYDADWLRDMLISRGIEPVIPPERAENHRYPTMLKNTNGVTWSRITFRN